MKNILMSAMLAITLSIGAFDASASTKCFKPADNAEQGASIGGFDKESTIKQGYEEVQDPVMDLMACFMQTAYEGPQSVIQHCGCIESIRELCTFKWDDGILKIGAKGGASKAWCVPFAFLAY